MKTPYQIAVSIARSEGNKSARLDKRKKWNVADTQVAALALNSLLRS
jgi:hypothetical protein